MEIKIVDFARNGKKTLLLMKEAEKLCVLFEILCLIILKSVILNGTMTPITDTSTANFRQNQRFSIKSLKSSAHCQMTILTAFSTEAVVKAETSYAIAWNTARSRRPYNNGEFTKENILQVASILDPS